MMTYLQFYSLNSEIISITFYVIIVTFTSYYLKAQLPKKACLILRVLKLISSSSVCMHYIGNISFSLFVHVNSCIN